MYVVFWNFGISPAAEKRKRGEEFMTESAMKTKAGELAKKKYNGVVRLRFQAAFVNEFGEWVIAVAHSQAVHDASKFDSFLSNI